MNCTIKYNFITFDIEYNVDSEGDYDQFDIEISGQQVNDVLSKEVIDALEYKVWHEHFIPEAEQNNTDLAIMRYESSIGV